PLDQVRDVAEGPGLRSLAVDSQRLVRECLRDEVADNAAIIGGHPGAVRVEDTDDADVDAVAAVVVHEQRLGTPLALVVTRSDTDGVDPSPVAFGLRMYVRVAVDFTGAGLQDSRTNALGQSQHVQGTGNRGLDCFDRVVLVMDRAGGACQVVDLVDLQINGLCDVVADQLKPGMVAEVGDIAFATGEEIVQANDLVAGL